MVGRVRYKGSFCRKGEHVERRHGTRRLTEHDHHPQWLQTIQRPRERVTPDAVEHGPHALAAGQVLHPRDEVLLAIVDHLPCPRAPRPRALLGAAGGPESGERPDAAPTGRRCVPPRPRPRETERHRPPASGTTRRKSISAVSPRIIAAAAVSCADLVRQRHQRGRRDAAERCALAAERVRVRDPLSRAEVGDPGADRLDHPRPLHAGDERQLPNLFTSPSGDRRR